MKTRASISSLLCSPLLCAANLASAKYIYVTSYSGTVSTLQYTPSQSDSTTAQLLTPIKVSTQCSDNPSWLTLDAPAGVAYCINEGLNTPNGSLTSLRTSADGSLTALSQVSTLGGPVSGIVFGENRTGLALAHYGASALSTWDISDASHLRLLETKTFSLTHPAADPARQTAPHPHEAVLDPTGAFLLLPDLGADVIRIYGFDARTLALKELPAVGVKGGYGPRHVAFAVRGGRTFAYLVTELTNRIVGYEVTYPGGSIELSELFDVSSHAGQDTVPENVYTAEVAVAPGGNFLLVSSRGDNSMAIPNLDAGNSSAIVSDPIFTFAIGDDGSLEHLQDFPAGGKYPRQFAISEDGALVVVGLQNDGRVTVIERDVKSGLLQRIVAYANVAGQVTCAVL